MPESDSLEFVPLHFGRKLRIVNPHGRIGVLTLWSRIDYVESKLRELGIDLDQHTSRIAAIGNLYGNGLPHLLRNLLFNPQIRDLVVCGTDRSGSCAELVSFFERGLEQAESLGEKVTRIAGTSRVIDDLVTPESFAEKPRIVCVGDLKSDSSLKELHNVIHSCVPPPPASRERVEIALPEVNVSFYPSNPRNHNIVKDTPLEAWRELVFRLVRFGRPVRLRKGERQELQNVRVVVVNPRADAEDRLREFGFDLADVLAYQKDMLEAELPADQPYTYGNRIRSYYGYDALELFAERLRENPQDRDCYLALWDSRVDPSAEDAPCLVSMFFRVFDEKLTLTATYRTHNALDAWLKNVYGLMEAQRVVAERVGLEAGPLTIISHSISIDPSKYDFARRVAETKGFSMELDPNGQFLVTLDEEAGEILVQHTTEDGIILGEYRSAKAERIQYELNRDCAISDINHAIYIGRMLAKAEECLRTGEEFAED